jgi:NADH:ubiquinone reductase (H+-translocating)
MSSNGSRPRVVVLGAGFAGLHAVRELAGGPADVLWLDARNYHTFLPLLYQVATAGLEPQAIVYPTRSFLRRLPDVTFRMERITGGDPVRRVLTTEEGEEIAYDYLIVATGGAAEDFGIPGVRDNSCALYDVDDARLLRNRVLTQLEHAAGEPDGPDRAARLTFVIVGAGPTGVETAGALAELRRHVVPSDYPSIPPESLRIVILEAANDVLLAFDETLRARARRDLAGFGVEVRLGTKVDAVSAGSVHLAGGETIAARTIVWAAGIRAGAVTAHLGLPTGRSGRLRTTTALQSIGQENVFVAGDVALVDGQERLPQVAQVAMQGGTHAARNVRRAIEGKPLEPFVYDDKGSMATIGRSRAVAQIGRIKLTGALAWWAWLFLHVVMLIGFRNRAVVLVNWAWNYLTYDRGLRAILGASTRAEANDRDRSAGRAA